MAYHLDSESSKCHGSRCTRVSLKSNSGVAVPVDPVKPVGGCLETMKSVTGGRISADASGAIASGEEWAINVILSNCVIANVVAATISGTGS